MWISADILNKLEEYTCKIRRKDVLYRGRKWLFEIYIIELTICEDSGDVLSVQFDTHTEN